MNAKSISAKVLLSLSVCVIVLALALGFVERPHSLESNLPQQEQVINQIAPMPIVSDGAYQTRASGATPTPRRGSEYNRWLSNGVGVVCSNNGVGSGTIIYYDGEWAYVQ